jgi:hypothetical protein
MFCYILYMEVNNENIDRWERLLIKTKLNNLSIADNKILTYYEVSDLNEYIIMIKSNINDIDKITEIKNNYNQRKKERLDIERKIDKERMNKIINDSIKISKYDINIKIKLLIHDETLKATELYQKFKPDELELEDFIYDFILKNKIFGIFEKEELAGIIIIEYNRIFEIGEKIPTFYIQEIYIDDIYRRRGFADLLFKYSILLCPINIQYITFMTSSSNIPMINIAKKYNFILYKKSSGDFKNPLLFIRINNNNTNEFKSSFL